MSLEQWNASREFAQTPFGRIAFHEVGSGPTALFFHGAILNSYQWRDVMPALADVRRCIAYDNLGHGYTEISDDQAVDFGTQAEAAAAFLDAVGAGQVDIVGNDSGGAIAQVFAARFPSRVRSITLTNCDASTNSPPPSFQPVVDLARAGVLRGIIPGLMNVDVARSANGLGNTYEHPERITPELLEAYIGPLVRTPQATINAERFIASMEPKYTLDIEPQLRTLNVPALIAWGDLDETFSAEWAQWLAETLPGARPPVIIEGARLFWPEERPEQLAGLLRKLWTEAAAGK